MGRSAMPCLQWPSWHAFLLSLASLAGPMLLLEGHSVHATLYMPITTSVYISDADPTPQPYYRKRKEEEGGRLCVSQSPCLQLQHRTLNAYCLAPPQTGKKMRLYLMCNSSLLETDESKCLQPYY